MNTRIENAILVVSEDTNDSITLINQLGWTMRREGCDLVHASADTDIHKICLYLRPLLVIINLLNPEIQGDDLIMSLKDEYETRDISVIVLIDRAGSGIDIGADDYMKKPVNPEKLADFVRAVMSRDTIKIDPLDHEANNLSFISQTF